MYSIPGLFSDKPTEQTSPPGWTVASKHNSFPIELFQSYSKIYPSHFPISSIHSLSRVRLFVTPWTAARQASLSITNSRSLHKHMPLESVMPSNHFILCCPLLYPPSIFPSIKVFSNESTLRRRWPKYWISASASVLSMNTQD